MTTIQGLSEKEALARRQRGEGNDIGFETSRSYRDILRRNLFNFINVVIFCIGVLLVLLGQTSDALTSVGLILLNVVIGAYQETRAKRQLDRIALLTRPKVSVIREGSEKGVDPSEVVLGDLLVIRPGDQIVVDGVVVSDSKVEVDESLLTGESELIPKSRGDTVLSGSFCVTGSAMYEAQKVGAQSFANRLTASARAFRVTKTPLQREVDFAIRLLTLIALFLGFLMAISAALNSLSFTRSVQAAAVIAGIVPNGLFFTVIIAYALGAVRISQRGALIQQSNAVESLSNVDLLCMDKTGTLTANRINFHDVYPIGMGAETLKGLLGDFSSSTSVTNRTGEAITEALGGKLRPVVDEVTFSSARKWSALAFDDGTLRGVYVLGALEMLQPYLQAGFDLSGPVKEWSDAGLRVLLFAHHPDTTSLHDAQEQPQLPPSLIPLGLLSFSDELRAEARETLDLVGLADKADRPIKGFSGGERQRLGIAQAQINHPDLLILDEPAAALDPMGRHDVLEVMERLRKYTTIFYSTHILDDVQRVSDAVAILNRGELVAQAPIEELLAGSDETSYILTLEGDAGAAQARVAGQAWVSGIQVTPGADRTIWQVAVTDEKAAKEQLLRLVLADEGLTVIEFGRKTYELEEIFLNIVQGGEDG